MTRLRWCTIAGVLGFAALVWILTNPAERATVAQDVRDPKGTGGKGNLPNEPGPVGPVKGKRGGNGGADPKQKHTLEFVRTVHRRHHLEQIRRKGVAAIGIMEDPAQKGEYAIRMLVIGDPAPNVPEHLDGVPVYSRFLTEPIKPEQAPLPYQTFCARPTYIGISAGNGGCATGATGTLGARLRSTRDLSYLALSNNHVFALENAGSVGDPIFQPGAMDDNCSVNSSNSIGQLKTFIPIDFSGTNKFDAAIASTSPAMVGYATLPDGYGAPTRRARFANLGEIVQKYGRTEGFVRGRVITIDVTVRIGYSSGSALFVDQLEIAPVAPFTDWSNGGDSGSLVVDANRNPVGLHFAGGGATGFINPIPDMLRFFRAKVDDGGVYTIVREPPPGKRGTPVPRLPGG